MNEALIFNELSMRKGELQAKILDLLKDKNIDAYTSLMASLEKVREQESLKIAFVGQHNSGKSTIVTALTNNHEIKISNNVETDVSADYKWNDVLLTDTPGLYAGMKEEHDSRTLETIKQSDLLVFCITSSLFDDLLINNFINLAYKQMYKTKMFLLINKMSQESGEFKELERNYNDTLIKTLRNDGGNLSDFPVSFVDAHDYLDGINEHDKELIEYSNFESFISDLNKYISSKKLSAKLDTPCRLLNDAIDSEIASTGTEFDKNFATVLRQAQSSIHMHRNNVRKYLLDIKSGVRNEIMGEANELIARMGNEEVDKNDVNSLNDKIEAITQTKVNDLQEYVNTEVNDMNQDISEILTSDIGNFILDNIKNKKVDVKSGRINKDFEDFASKYQSVSGTITQKAAKVADASGVTNAFGKVSQASGSQVHSVVVSIGHFFGKSFKPWEAVKIADKVGKFAKGLGPALAVISLGIDVVGKFKEDKNIKELEQSKRETFNQFSSIASDIAEQIEAQYKACEKEIFGKPEEQIEEIRNDSIKTIKNNTDYVKELQNLRTNVSELIGDINKA